MDRAGYDAAVLEASPGVTVVRGQLEIGD